MSGVQRLAISELISKAESFGVPVPDEVRRITADICAPSPVGGALLWAQAHGEEQGVPCCWGTASGRGSDCTCWTPVFDVEQEPPQLIASHHDATAAPDLCGDCAFRPGSPERATSWERETLFGLADRGEPFWCHRGMRQPVRWEHPDGRVIDGSSDDWKPAIVDAIPYQADGTPAVLCGGWAKRAGRAT